MSTTESATTVDSRDTIPNILAGRYASKEIRAIWSPRRKIELERELWIAVMEVQRELGVDIPLEAIEASRRVVGEVDLDAITAREHITKHDVKARIDIFCELSGHEHIHKGMTARDLTENVEQMQILQSLKLIRDRVAAALHRLAVNADVYAQQPVAGRSHNVAAQMTTIGKRFANAGQELLEAYEALENLITRYALRGMKGPVGTSQDMLNLFGGDYEKLEQFELRIREFLGFERGLDNTGQVYPRSLDLGVVAVLAQLAGGPSSFATTVRLMAGQELATEGFLPGQVGSTAMPHKMNARSCERICGLNIILGGHLVMANGMSGNQWNEGDVSCSVVRRYIFPDAFLALDAIFETFLTVLDGVGVYPAVIHREIARFFPFLTTTAVLMAAVKAGAGREAAHEAIKEHAVATALAMRVEAGDYKPLMERLEEDPRIPLEDYELLEIIDDPMAYVGNALGQTRSFFDSVEAIAERYPDAVDYTPAPIL